ncbi:MAG: hypothetical protein UX19_C0002G0059 [Candidatus Woesebacteria bacterium GW2011_GWA1_45_8]|uniref:Type II secretion system protein n=1 Tax=Candidatus Woesebacteria bacterium GW2011_GWA1_45_8 TaxID=1618559 RepID=A0A0G1MVZ1_9BACT|nr:MAG: hypothetical protein UX19_C0002G0059 [Candidatus Woesebacteria bacterium GW2011_GWA1_45_8]
MLITIAIIGILATTSFILINPQRQLAKSRDTQRRTDLYSIATSVYQYSAEHSGALPDTDGDPATSNFPTSATCIGTGGGCFNLAGAGAAMPFDPKTGVATNTGYLIYKDANERVVISAVGETEPTITVTK